MQESGEPTRNDLWNLPEWPAENEGKYNDEIRDKTEAGVVVLWENGKTTFIPGADGTQPAEAGMVAARFYSPDNEEE